MTETPANSEVVVACIPFSTGAVTTNNGTFEADPTDTISHSYTDPNDSTDTCTVQARILESTPADSIDLGGQRRSRRGRRSASNSRSRTPVLPIARSCR